MTIRNDEVCDEWSDLYLNPAWERWNEKYGPMADGETDG